MRRRAFLIAQVMVLGVVALGLAFAAFSRTANQMHLVGRALDAEQDGVMLDALEQLTAGQAADVVLQAPGWDDLRATRTATGWTLTARRPGRPESVRLLARP